MANFSMVSADQIETFRRDGFLHIPGLVDEPALALLRAAMDDLFGASDGDPGVNNVTAYAAKAKARGTTVLADRHAEEILALVDETPDIAIWMQY